MTKKDPPLILPVESVNEYDSKRESPAAKAPDISVHDDAAQGNNEAIKKCLSAGMNVNVKDESGWTQLYWRLKNFAIKLLKCLSRQESI